MERTLVDDLKEHIRDYCWRYHQLHVRRRDFQLWVQTHPPNSPTFPRGHIDPLCFDSTWMEVLNMRQLSPKRETTKVIAFSTT